MLINICLSLTLLIGVIECRPQDLPPIPATVTFENATPSLPSSSDGVILNNNLNATFVMTTTTSAPVIKSIINVDDFNSTVENINSGIDLGNVFATLFNNFGINQQLATINQQESNETTQPQPIYEVILPVNSTTTNLTKFENNDEEMMQDQPINTDLKFITDSSTSTSRMMSNIDDKMVILNNTNMEKLPETSTTQSVTTTNPNPMTTSTSMIMTAEPEHEEMIMTTTSTTSAPPPSPPPQYSVYEEHLHGHHVHDIAMETSSITSSLSTTTENHEITVHDDDENINTSAENIQNINGSRNIEPTVTATSHEFEKYITQTDMDDKNNSNTPHSVRIPSTTSGAGARNSDILKISSNSAFLLIIYLICYNF